MPDTNDPEYAAFEAEMMSRPDIREHIANMSEEDRYDFMEQLFRDYTGEQSGLEYQRDTADELRNRAGPEGRSQGDVYVAANPLEHLASGLSRRKAGGEYDEAVEGLEELSASRTEGLKSVGEGLLTPYPGQPDPRQQQQRALADYLRAQNDRSGGGYA